MISKDIELLETIFALVKRVKKPIVKIFPDGRIIGTDEQFASLNITSIELNEYGLFPCSFIIDTKEISAFMKEVSKDYEYYKPVFDYPFRFITTCKKDILEIKNNIELNYKIDELYNKVISQELTKTPILIKENFQSEIPEMFSLKTSDGARFYNVDERFLMTSFNAIHPVNKSDKVTLIIRDSDLYSYIAEFVIFKKKENYELHEILRFRKL